MVMTPTSFTYENLSSMKFKELQKMSVQFHVNKRWAKKQELIENLLALKNKEKSSSDVHQDEQEQEWKDGSTAFAELHENNDKEVHKRLTFTVNSKCNIEHGESHLTFEVPQSGKTLLNDSISSRKTYEVLPGLAELDDEALKESRATFDIPQKKELIDEVDPRATFDIPQNGKELLQETKVKKSKRNDSGEMKKKKITETRVEEVNESVPNPNLRKIKFDINIKDGKQSRGGQEESQVKTLTIPYARVTRRTKKDAETSKTDKTPIKISKKSINIKKSTRLPVSKNDLIKSPAISSARKTINRETIIKTLIEHQSGKLQQSKVPVRLQLTKKEINSNKENIKHVQKKRTSTSPKETLRKESNGTKVNFRTPPAPATKATKVLFFKKTPSSKPTDGRLNTSAAFSAGTKSNVSKPITKTKMPDFRKIHKKQFEQMDSLEDYLKKKEERIRKLFGTPQPGQQLQALNKSASVFRFQSATGEKDSKGGNVSNGFATPLKRKENAVKSVQKEAFRNKLPPSNLRTDIKDKNRSHIHGVRTNKRFELQMKFRKM